MTARRLGFLSAAGLATIGVAYAVALAVGFARHGLHEPIADPVLAVMEALTLLAAPVLVALMAAIHDRAPKESKVFGLLAVAFATLAAGITSTVHFVELTAGRQLGSAGLAWPSRAYAAELLAWDGFLGLALACAALTFASAGPERVARRALLVCGALCLAGTVGPLLGNMRVQLLGVLGYACLLPWVAILLARLFGRGEP